MGCYDPLERDLAQASDQREELACEVARLQAELREAVRALSTRAALAPALWGPRVEALRARTEPLLGRAFHGRFTWGDAPPIPGTEDTPGGPWPDFGSVHATLNEAEETRLALERLLCEVRGTLVGSSSGDSGGGALPRNAPPGGVTPWTPGPVAPDEDLARERARHLAHRLEDRAAWLAHAASHRAVLEAALATAGTGGAKKRARQALAAWERTMERVERLDDAEVLAEDALPPLPGVAAR